MIVLLSIILMAANIETSEITALCPRIIKTNVSHVAIYPNLVIKRVPLRPRSYNGCMISELFVLNMLSNIPGFSQVIEARIERAKCYISLINAGDPLTLPVRDIDAYCRIAELVAMLHAHKIVHGDIKTNNILMDDVGNITLIDYTHSYIACDSSSFGYVVDITATTTPSYAAPESLQWHHLSFATDIWALGCLYYHWYTGESLFNDPYEGDYDARRNAVMAQHIEHEYVARIRRNVSDETISRAIVAMTALDYTRRPTAVQLLREYFQCDNYAPDVIFNTDMLSANDNSETRRAITRNITRQILTICRVTQKCAKYAANIILNAIMYDKWFLRFNHRGTFVEQYHKIIVDVISTVNLRSVFAACGSRETR